MKTKMICLVAVLGLLSAGFAYPPSDLPASAPWSALSADLPDPGDDEDARCVCDDAGACEAAADGAVHPVATYLAEQHDVDYAEVMDWFCRGYGMGEIKLALTLSEAQATGGPDWQTLLAAKTDGVGWGQIKLALWVAEASGQTWDVVLLQRTEDELGWGQIRQSLGLIGRLRHQSDDDDAGPLPDADEEGVPEHGGPWGDNGRGNPGPPDHAGPKDKGDRGTHGPPDHAGPKDKD